MIQLDGSKEKLEPVQSEETVNSTEKMIREERFTLILKNRSISADIGFVKSES